MKSVMRKIVVAMGIASVAIVASADVNTWVATASGLASDGNNWSLARAPIASDDIRFDNSSSFPCTWDEAAVSSVASWEQTSDFTGTNTIATVYDGAFTVLTVSGNMTLNGGSLTHIANNNSQEYRLNLAIGGDLTVGENAMIDARAKGYAVGCFPEGGALGVHAGGNVATNVYGDVYHPIAIGAGNKSPIHEFQNYSYPGGGAVKVSVGGVFILDGQIRVDSTDAFQDLKWFSQTAIYHGAAGSVWIIASSMSGDGKIWACGGAEGTSLHASSGGRVAINLTAATQCDFPVTNIAIYGTLGNYDNTVKCCGSSGGGTLVVKTADQTYGTLYISNAMRSSSRRNSVPGITGTTIIPSGETWVFDALVFDGTRPGTNSKGKSCEGNGVLMIPSGATLSLVNGLESVSGSTRKGGILMNGGVLSLPEGAQTIQNNWTLSSNVPFTLSRDVTVLKDGAIGCLPLMNRKDFPLLADITIEGNLTVKKEEKDNDKNTIPGGYLWADSCGFTTEPDYQDYLNDLCGPNQTYFSYGGQIGVYGFETNAVYGSVLNPTHPGNFGQFMNGTAFNDAGWSALIGGGAMKITVTGVLTLDGKATATSPRNQYSAMGTGGSINLTVGKLEGGGSITVTGDKMDVCYNSNTAALVPIISKMNNGSALPAAGRIAIRLTNSDAIISDKWKSQLKAKGLSWEKTDKNAKLCADYPNILDRFSSAGTIYLQDGNTKEGMGTILISDSGSYNLKAYTMLPSLENGKSVDDLSKVSLEIIKKARVAVGASKLKVRHASIDDTSVFELGGRTLITESLTIAGNEIPVGVYYGGDAALQGIVVDSSIAQSGRVQVTGRLGFSIIVR